NNSLRTTFGYDNNGNQTTINTYANGVTAGPNVSSLSATYTSGDQLKAWTETICPLLAACRTTGTGGTVAKSGSMTYAPDGLVASRTLDGFTTTYTQDRRGLEATTATAWASLGTFTTT